MQPKEYVSGVLPQIAGFEFVNRRDGGGWLERSKQRDCFASYINSKLGASEFDRQPHRTCRSIPTGRLLNVRKILQRCFPLHQPCPLYLLWQVRRRRIRIWSVVQYFPSYFHTSYGTGPHFGVHRHTFSMPLLLKNSCCRNHRNQVNWNVVMVVPELDEVCQQSTYTLALLRDTSRSDADHGSATF